MNNDVKQAYIANILSSNKYEENMIIAKKEFDKGNYE